MQYIGELTEENLKGIKSGQYFTYKIYNEFSNKIFYRKGLKINRINMIPIGGYSETIEQAEKAY